MSDLIFNDSLEIPADAKRAFMNSIGGGVWAAVVPGIALLRLVPVAGVSDGTPVHLAYHSSATFGGGGIFLWKITESRDDNNGTVIMPAGHVGPGRWVRVEYLENPAYVDITWFGARNNTPGFDNGLVINHAIQQLPLLYGTQCTVDDGYMRNGRCQVPGGTFFTSRTIVATGSMELLGVGPAKSTIALNDSAAGFTSAPWLAVTAVTAVYVGFVAVMNANAYLLNLTVTGHGKRVTDINGNLCKATGWVRGINGPNSYYLNRWHRMRVIDANTIQVLFNTTSGAVFTREAWAAVQLDSWLVDFQTDLYAVSMNNTFGTVCKDLQISCRARSAGNAGSSGLQIAGAQQSYVQDVTVSDTGVIGSLCEVAAHRLWCAGSIQGPGYLCQSGPCIENGVIHSEHTNQGGYGPYIAEPVYTMYLSDGTVVPRPAFFLQNAVGWRARQCQGEDSPWEMVIESSPKVSVDKFVINGPSNAAPGSEATLVRDGWETTMLYITGDCYEYEFDRTFFFGTFKNLANDQSALAISHGDTGIKSDFSQMVGRNGAITNGANLKLRGPYADDAAAAAKNVPVGATYYKSDGSTRVRIT
jgi:hypothetical protein